MSTAGDVLKTVSKQYGDGVASQGVVVRDTARIPTNVFAFDLATGGGIPRGRTSILYGPESSMKTSLALRTIASEQRLNPAQKCAFVDLEGSYDPKWGAVLGVDNEALIYLTPDHAEQAVDLIEAFLSAEDVSIVVVDSLAAMITTNEIKNSAETAVVGGSGLAVGKLYRKSTLAISKAKRDDRYPTLICINQIRTKVGVMYGDPEVMPGGNAFKFGSSLTVRLYGKDEFDKKVSSALPAWKKVSGIIKKWKVPVVARTFEAWVAAIDSPMIDVDMGASDDWKTVLYYLKNYEKLDKLKDGWRVLDEVYPTQAAIRDRFFNEPAFSDTLRASIVAAALSGDATGTPDEDEEPLL